MVTTWRIVDAEYANSAFDGEGARVSGGRWNSPGTPVIYTAASAALAALEILVHRESDSLPSPYVLFSCSFDDGLVTVVKPEQLPGNWRSSPAPTELQEIGDRWARQAVSAVLRVPSVVIPTESNYLLNPQHPDFDSIVMSPLLPFELDQRLR